jgi:hypothetical protein
MSEHWIKKDDYAGNTRSVNDSYRVVSEAKYGLTLEQKMEVMKLAVSYAQTQAGTNSSFKDVYNIMVDLITNK